MNIPATHFLRMGLVTFMLLALLSTGQAQDIFRLFSQWSSANPVEKLYLHTDRSSYHAGQTIWLKGYFLNDLSPDSKSTSVYVELLDGQSNIRLRHVFPAYMGICLGQVALPGDISSGTYQLRAYSAAMLNQPGFYFTKNIFIYGRQNAEATAASSHKVNDASTSIRFFPEGGNLVANLVNNIAFKATDQNGLPKKVSCILKNDKGETLDTFSSVHDGMGRFSMMPLPGQSYYVVQQGDEQLRYPLPEAKTKGITLVAGSSNKGYTFKIEQAAGTPPELRAASIVGQMHHHIVFRQPLNAGNDLLAGIIPAANLPSGILQLTVFNKDDMPLAERLLFLDNKEYKIDGYISPDSVSAEPYQRNRITINLPDTIIGHFSISVTDADFEPHGRRPSNIFSWFLLQSDIKGYVHNPAFYFQADADSVKDALDLVMMTNGWRRFNWIDVAANKLTPARFADDGYITLKGTILNEANRRPVANTDLFFMMKPVTDTSAGNGLPRLIHTDEQGHFRIDSLIFYDKMRLAFSDIRGTKSRFLQVKMNADSLHKPFYIEPAPVVSENGMQQATGRLMQDAYSRYMEGRGRMLQNVTVTARTKTEKEKLDEAYTSGYFRGGVGAKTLDIREEIGTDNIFDFIRTRIPGISVYREDEAADAPADASSGYVVKHRQLNSDYFPTPPLQLFLDEMPTSSVFIETIPLSQIAYVKVFPTFTGSAGGNGALAVYTKKGKDAISETVSFVSAVDYNGYTVVKEFYSPDYAAEKPANSQPDSRLTLLWQPDIYLASVNPRLPVTFYNNGRTKRFKIVIEGITSDGQMLMLEKTIEQ